MDIRSAAVRYLAYPKTASELRHHLSRKGFDSEDIRQVVQEFIEDGYLDDLEYCKMYIPLAMEKGKARKRITEELKHKGIDRATVDMAYERIDTVTDERHMAREEAARILRLAGIGGNTAVPEKVIGRVARRLEAYGYSTDIIYGIIGELRRNGDI